jgi:hypothetical protein
MIPIPSDWRRFRRLSAFFLLGAAALALYFGQHDFPVRVIGLIAIMSAVGLAKSPRGALSIAEQKNRPPPLNILHWAIAILLTGALALVYRMLWVAGHDGSTSVWPVYEFAGTGLIAGAYWAALLTRLQESGTRWPWTEPI